MKCKLYINTLHTFIIIISSNIKGGSTLGQGATAPRTSALSPNVTWNTVWRTRSIGIIGEKRAFCGLKNTPKFVTDRGSTGGAHDAATDPLVGWGRHPSPYRTHTLPIECVWLKLAWICALYKYCNNNNNTNNTPSHLAPSALATRRLNLVGVLPPNIIVYNRPCIIIITNNNINY